MFKKSNTATNVDIDLNSVVVTHKTISRIFLALVEFLSYNRNQIPLVYETFNRMVKNLEKAHENDQLSNVKNFSLERQREIAIQTNQKFQEIFNLLIKSFNKHEISQGIIVFGATIFTAKEAFVINLPSKSDNHLPDNHLDSILSTTRKVIMSIITSTEFFDANGTNLKPTNMYILLKTTHKIDESMAANFQRLDYFQLPTLCRITKLNIQNDSNNLNVNCCRDLSIFNDATSNGHKINGTTFNRNECNGTEHKNHFNDNGTSSDSNTFNKIDTNEFLYECKISIKGFRDQLINGKTIWI